MKSHSRGRKRLTRNRLAGLALFLLYLLLLFRLMFFSEMEERGLLVKEAYTYNLTPFLEIRRYVFFGKKIGRKGVLLNLFGNIIGFMPFGFFLPVISMRARNYWYNTVIASYILSWWIEMMQLLFRAGSCDVDDIILNTLGGFLGYVLFCIVQLLREARNHTSDFIN